MCFEHAISNGVIFSNFPFFVVHRISCYFFHPISKIFRFPAAIVGSAPPAVTLASHEILCDNVIGTGEVSQCQWGRFSFSRLMSDWNRGRQGPAGLERQQYKFSSFKFFSQNFSKDLLRAPPQWLVG